MSCAISFEMSKARTNRSLGYHRSLAGVPSKPMPSPSNTCPAYRTEKYLIIVVPSLHMPALRGRHRAQATPLHGASPGTIVEAPEARKKESRCLIFLWSICTSAAHGYCVGLHTP